MKIKASSFLLVARAKPTASESWLRYHAAGFSKSPLRLEDDFLAVGGTDAFQRSTTLFYVG